MMGSAEVRPPHAVCMPYPAQGHVTPMFKLAKLLHARGFHVTFVNTEYNHRRILQSQGAAAMESVPGFRFAAIPDGLPPSDADATQDIPALCYSTMTTCLPHLLHLLEKLNHEAAEVEAWSGPVTCLLFDTVMSFGYDAAQKIGVPAVALWTASCCGFMGYRNYRNLVDDWGLVPFKHATDLADVDGGPLSTVSERLSLPDAVVVNSFDDLEGPTLDAMRAILPPMHAVGPLLLLERRLVPAGSPLSRLGSSLWEVQGGLVEWLDGHEARSVVYVNFGSITVMTNEQLLEFAWGLANSGYPFVWNIRPDLLKGDAAVLPPEFLAARC
ncbi:hypothetical protein PR202_gb25995 [Eleusine coracana subsp. coracana]|uniref:Uncharacterized protein n=1 Tax=Eleusine coracana subsp. coracana TaxID=191504 RepID=A0AAV5FMX9_ELECO|nr:hypothetical protein QOZ80_4BG0356000 [Eleusine coracana subsp. coracana]GJN37074.1 hypothetical protein PR202_gb25995 [Eleusine coracana subsp. coracana]